MPLQGLFGFGLADLDYSQISVVIDVLRESIRFDWCILRVIHIPSIFVCVGFLACFGSKHLHSSAHLLACTRSRCILGFCFAEQKNGANIDNGHLSGMGQSQ
jgi:hypothetical protein